MSEWKTLLEREVAATSCAAVARKLAVSRTAVSLALRGKYPGGTACMAKRVLEHFDTVSCPLAETPVTRAACTQRQADPMPTSSPAALEAWLTCKRCPRRGHNHQE